jgi:hypothetical protein
LNASIITHNKVASTCAGRLDHEDVGSADVLVDLKRDLGVRETLQSRVADLDTQELRDLFGQGAMRAARKDLELPAGHCCR